MPASASSFFLISYKYEEEWINPKVSHHEVFQVALYEGGEDGVGEGQETA